MSERKLRVIKSVGQGDVQGGVLPPTQFKGYFKKEDTRLEHPYLWSMALFGRFCFLTGVLKKKVDVTVNESARPPLNLPRVTKVMVSRE